VTQRRERGLVAAGDPGQQVGDVGTGGLPCYRRPAARSSRAGWAPRCGRRAGPAFFRGGPAPDAILLGYQGIGQAARLHRAAAADGLRRADLRQRGADRRNGKEKLRVLTPASTARHPARGTGAIRVQHGDPSTGTTV
jgi:hypothetical protein